LQIDTNKLAELLNNVSKGRYGDKRALTKANQIRESALNSFGITVGTDVFKIQFKLLLEQINLFEEHLKQIETTMIEISNRQEHFLTTITGISDMTACVTLAAIGSIGRFHRHKQFIAFLGFYSS